MENCPKQCPGGSDDECGNDMICFDMSTEKVSCNETGVGIKDPVDPLRKNDLFKRFISRPTRLTYFYDIIVKTYGAVRRGTTFWRIVRRLAPKEPTKNVELA